MIYLDRLPDTAEMDYLHILILIHLINLVSIIGYIPFCQAIHPLDIIQGRHKLDQPVPL